MTVANKDKIKIKSANLFPVVGIGASAGGLDAFKRLLKAIPEKSGMAYILVQHLDPTHESILADLLQRVTTIPVQEITDNVQVVADNIYIIPSNKLLTATDGVLKLSDRPSKGYRNMPIDLFFSSLAEVHQDHAIGVVLSGTATDGTLGLKAIKDQGGITMAQELQSAAYDGMPQSAIDANVVDYVLSPEKIPGQLMILNNKLKSGKAGVPEDRQQAEMDEFNQILSLLRSRKGVDFTYYKQPTIRRRINRRIAMSNKESIVEYLAHLNLDKSELDILYQDLLIPVTQFFRDPKVFENLSKIIFPALVKGKGGNEPLRFWIAGCSTGEEAYSIVMCLHEFLEERISGFKIQVFATDISEIAIAKARTGIYKKGETTGLSPSRLQRFFSNKDGGFQVNKPIRDMCVFAFHNFLKDPPFAGIDLISCRNSLIYMEPSLQKKALATFHYSLNRDGFLLLGKSETASQMTDLFNIFEKSSKIYTRRPVKGRFLHEIPERKEEIFRDGKFGSPRNEIGKDDVQKNADEAFMSKYSPPGVVVNNELDIVQFRGAIGTWLEPSSGKPNLNVLKMAREGLSFELRNALHKSRVSKKAEIKEDIPILVMGIERLVTIEVIPLLNTLELHFLILFKDTSLPSGSIQHDTTEIQSGESLPLSKDKKLIHKLQKELAQTRADMKGITEDQEAFNEELQSANEELLSGSEELQSLNEELETAKEETQTSNEELIIVNQELYDRNEQLNLSRLYAESIVTTIREPLIILNSNLLIKSANKSFYAKFETTAEATEGKHLFELADNLWNIQKLREMMGKVLPGKATIVDYEVTLDLPGLGERIMLLNASVIFRDKNEEQLILLAIEDITEKRKVDNALHLFSEELENQVADRTLSLHEANIELTNSNKNLEQFAYIASHDLQEPLRKIRTFSSIIQSRHKNDLTEAVKEMVGKIETSAERMSNLISEVLNFSKILHNDDKAFEKTDLNDIIREVLNDFDLLVHDKQAVIDQDPLPVIDAIRGQMTQLFYNLLSNALKFTKKGIPPVISITSRIVEPNDRHEYPNLNPKLSYCDITIADNGIGFDQKYADQIFLIFHRLNGRDHYSGTGIGLALCKTIVVNHNGEIYGASKNNQGASFNVILPLLHNAIS